MLRHSRPARREGNRDVQRQVLVILMLLFCWLTSASPGLAYGALAAGVPDSVAQDGVSQQYWVGAGTPEGAAASALRACRDSKSSSSQAAVSRCQIVRTFSNQCVATSLDPEPGTPGYGWGVADDKDGAEREAIVMCYETSPADRTQYCKVTSSACDR
jgi:Domain of unknown function (DUF4189)